jgi:peroxiredoxin Q/BCP
MKQPSNAQDDTGAVPDFSLPATGGASFNLSGQRGRYVVLYFYPKDSTPGCTTEAMEFRDLHEAFIARGAVIAGVSRDSLRSHENFRSRLDLPFPLLSDADEALCARFAVIRDKKMYGKDVRGIERSTFLIGPDGRLLKEWRGIKAPGHAAEVLAAIPVKG